MAKTFSFTDEQIKALQAAIEGQMQALEGASRIYLAPKHNYQLLGNLLEGLKSATDAGGGSGEPVDAYTKSESDNKYLAKTDAESTYQKKSDAFTQTTADGLYLGKTAKATAATSADSATKATQDASGNVITETYATKAEIAGKVDSSALGDYVTSAQLTTILEGYQKVTE